MTTAKADHNTYQADGSPDKIRALLDELTLGRRKDAEALLKSPHAYSTFHSAVINTIHVALIALYHEDFQVESNGIAGSPNFHSTLNDALTLLRLVREFALHCPLYLGEHSTAPNVSKAVEAIVEPAADLYLRSRHNETPPAIKEAIHLLFLESLATTDAFDNKFVEERDNYPELIEGSYGVVKGAYGMAFKGLLGACLFYARGYEAAFDAPSPFEEVSKTFSQVAIEYNWFDIAKDPFAIVDVKQAGGSGRREQVNIQEQTSTIISVILYGAAGDSGELKGNYLNMISDFLKGYLTPFFISDANGSVNNKALETALWDLSAHLFKHEDEARAQVELALHQAGYRNESRDPEKTEQSPSNTLLGGFII